MTDDLVDRLMAECAHLRPVEDPELDALRRAVLVEDVLGVTVSDDEMDLEHLADPDSLRALAARPAPLA